MSFTVEELKSWAIDDEEYYSYADLWHEVYYGTEVDSPFGKVTRVAHWGGEGDGAEMFLVFSVGGRLFQITGYYSSYDSSSWDGPLVEVEPYEKTVVRYRKV